MQRIGILVAAIFLLTPLLTWAQTTHTVAPLLIDRTLEPRGRESVTITVENPSDRQLRLYATVNQVSVDDSGTITEFRGRSESENRTTVTSWLAINRGRIELPAGETRELPLSIEVHPQAEPGVYHAFVGLASGSNRQAAEAKVAAGNAPGSLVRIEIAENRSAYLQLEQFTTERLLAKPADGSLTYTLNNPSDTPLRPTGEVIVYDSRGHELGAVDLNIPQAIAPGEQKEFRVAMPDIGGGIGRHKAMVSIRYGDGQTALLQDTIFFYQVPMTQLLTIFFLCLAVAMGIAYWIHRRYRVDDTEEDRVTMYHRPQVVSEPKDHDLDLKPKTSHGDDT